MYLGIDLGTSNSAVVGNADGTLRLFKTSDGRDVLLLQHHDTRPDTTRRRDIADPQFDEVTPAQLAVERQVEQSQVPCSIADLQADADAPDMKRFKGKLGPSRPAARKPAGE